LLAIEQENSLGQMFYQGLQPLPLSFQGRKQTHLVQSHGNPVGDLTGDIHVFRCKGPRTMRPQVEGANQLALSDEGHGDVGSQAVSRHLSQCLSQA